MRFHPRYLFLAFSVILLLVLGCSVVGSTTTSSTAGSTTSSTTIANLQPYADPTGSIATYTSAGVIDESGIFFQPLGANARTCQSCHQLTQGMSITPTALQALGCATTLSATGQQIVSIYRRPLPAASLPFLSDVMWDARFTLAALNAASTFSANLSTDLNAQAINAVATHEQGSATPTTAQLTAILTFEQGLFTAQTTDSLAGSLSADGAKGPMR